MKKMELWYMLLNHRISKTSKIETREKKKQQEAKKKLATIKKAKPKLKKAKNAIKDAQKKYEESKKNYKTARGPAISRKVVAVLLAAGIGTGLGVGGFALVDALSNNDGNKSNQPENTNPNKSVVSTTTPNNNDPLPYSFESNSESKSLLGANALNLKNIGIDDSKIGNFILYLNFSKLCLSSDDYDMKLLEKDFYDVLNEVNEYNDGKEKSKDWVNLSDFVVNEEEQSIVQDFEQFRNQIIDAKINSELQRIAKQFFTYLSTGSFAECSVPTLNILRNEVSAILTKTNGKISEDLYNAIKSALAGIDFMIECSSREHFEETVFNHGSGFVRTRNI